ncbi:GlxA family transcriptional regulator [Oxalobacteraceae bacterium OM1]|nr:GlxA family transcriptional regulator [Oxalobacteraceae bacterium OM1]
MPRHAPPRPHAVFERPHRVVIAAFPPAQMLDVTGPLDVFATANAIAEQAGRATPYDIVLAGPRRGAMETTSGVALTATAAIHDAGLSADTLLVAGGKGARMAVHDRKLVAALAQLCRRSARVGSICTGAFVLAAAGLLDGRRATTHWAHFDEFAGLFPAIELDRDALFLGDGKVFTSAGISAGIDFALSLVERDLGRQFALKVAQELVVFLKRPGGQSQFSTHIVAGASGTDPDRFADLTHWIAANLARDLSVEALAARIAMSPRNFTRRFTEAVGVPPGKYVQALRVDAARRLLTDSRTTVARIAERCGFPSAEAMRVAFQRQIRVAPSEFRERFRASG